MKAIFAAIALLVAGVAAQNFTINTPSNVDECEPTLISWIGGTPPYYLSVLPGSSPSGPAIESFPATNATSLTWQVNIQSGTSIGLTLRDSNGNVAQTAAFTVNPGTDDSCLGSTSVSAGSTETSSSGASATASGTTTSGTSAGTTTGSSSSPSSSSTSSSGASANAAQLGAAAIVGVGVAALFL